MQPLLKTNDDTQQIIYAKRKSKNIPKEHQLITSMTTSRYGTTVDTRLNKVSETTDKHKTRDKLLPQDIENEKYYRISRINIDSRYRNKDPRNIVSKYITVTNPFKFKENSNILTIQLPQNHGINVDDNITITNLLPTTITQRPNTLTLKKNDKFLYINHENHGFVGSNNMINISNVSGSDPLNYFIGNISLSKINTNHNVILIKNDGVVDYNNYKVDLNIYSNSDYVYVGDYYKLNILTFNGVHIKYINAGYPITADVQQGYYTVIESSNENIKISLPVAASKSNTVGIGNPNINIGLITSTMAGYSDPSHYKIELKRTYYNVKKIKLVSTEIPNTEMLIKKTPDELKNDRLYWQIQDDGDYPYSINIKPGNYDAKSLATEISEKIANTNRFFGSYLDKNLYYNKCIPNIIINPYNNLFLIQILSKITMANNITINNDIYDDSYKRINITHSYHNLQVGNTVTISGAINVFDHKNNNIFYYVPDNIINNVHIVEEVLGINNYTIKLNKYNPVVGTEENKDAHGGTAVNILYPLTIRLLFTYKDTIGKILGFRDIGNEYAKTIFDRIITNQTKYVDQTNLNSTGLIDTNEPILKFYTYPYILLVSDIFNTTINIKDSVGVFAKLFLAGSPGSIIYDQYIQINETLVNSISYLNEIEFYFYTPELNLYNFNNQDHSFTLEIYEELEENDKIKD